MGRDVREGREGSTSDGEGEGGHLVDTIHELRAEIILNDPARKGFINSAAVVDAEDGESMREGLDAKLPEQSSLGGSTALIKCTSLMIST